MRIADSRLRQQVAAYLNKSIEALKSRQWITGAMFETNSQNEKIQETVYDISDAPIDTVEIPAKLRREINGCCALGAMALAYQEVRSVNRQDVYAAADSLVEHIARQKIDRTKHARKLASGGFLLSHGVVNYNDEFALRKRDVIDMFVKARRLALS